VPGSLARFVGMGDSVREQKDDGSGAVKSADRVLDLFELLGRWDGEMSHADIVEALGIPKSSLTQLLRTLVARGYVEFAASSKGYRLGDAFAGLTQRAADSRDLVAFVEPLLAEMTRTTRETSALNQLKGDMAEVVATVASSQRLVSHMRRGDAAPLYATSGGKAILAHLPEAMRNEYLSSVRLKPITPRTIRTKRELRRQIDEVREAGIAYSLEEFTPGIVGIGVPVLSEAGFPLGSLNIAMPAVRYSPATRDRAIGALTAARDRIERQFSGVRSPRARTG
jgi:DNA-binding IclR family transcriptional regulator